MEKMKKECQNLWSRHTKGLSKNFQGRVLTDAKKLFPHLKGKDLLNAVWNGAFWTE